MDKEHMLLSNPLFPSSRIRACCVVSPPNVRQWSFHKLNANPITDHSLITNPSLKSIKDSINTNHPHAILSQIPTPLLSSFNLSESTSTMSNPKHSIPHKKFNLNNPVPRWSQGIQKKNPKPITGNCLRKTKGCFEWSQRNESPGHKQQRVTSLTERGWFR